MLDLRIINGKVVGPESMSALDIGISNGCIVEIAPPGGVSRAEHELDATDLCVMAGAIDSHFHCRAPANPERGDFTSETRAAAAGGVTTVFEMPISKPACSSLSVFERRREIASAASYVNVALYAGANGIGTDYVHEMADAGAIGFKLFTIPPPPGREDEFEGLWSTDLGDVYDIFSRVAKSGRPCVVHAEDADLVRHFAMVGQERAAVQRPPLVEAVATYDVAIVAKAVGARVHIAHVSSRAGLEALTAAREAGTDITAETCPQYLLLNSETIARFGPRAKVTPPLREPHDAAALWDALADGRIDLAASDHAPFRLREKVDMPYSQAPSGLPTVELLVPTLLNGAAEGRVSLLRAVELLTAAPARRFDLFPRKGAIRVGADADLAVFTLGRTYEPSPTTLFSRGRDCGVVYEGIKLNAAIVATIVGGQIVFREGNIVGAPCGRFIAPSALSA